MPDRRKEVISHNTISGCGVSARVLDVIRCRIVCSQLSGLLGVLAAIDGVQGMRVLRRKNKFHPKALMPSHFRNILMSVQVPTIVVSLQALPCPRFANCLKYIKVEVYHL